VVSCDEPGDRAGALFLNDADRRRFLGAAAELPERFGLGLHAFVLMHNHYHLLVRIGIAHLVGVEIPLGEQVGPGRRGEDEFSHGGGAGRCGL